MSFISQGSNLLLIGAFCLLLVTPVVGDSYTMQIFFIGVCLILLLAGLLIELFVTRELAYQRNPSVLTYLLFCVIAFLSIFKAVNPWEAFLYIVALFFLFVIFFVGTSRHISKSFFLKTGFPLVALASILIALHNNFTRPAQGFVIFLFPMVFYLIFSTANLVRFFIFLIAAVVLSFYIVLPADELEKMMAFTGIIAGMVVIVKRYKLLLIMLLLIAISTVFFIIASGVIKLDIETRVSIWKGCLKLWSREPILGIGGGNFQERFQSFREQKEFEKSNPHITADAKIQEVEDAHNMFLQILVEHGMIGFFAFLYFTYVVLRRLAFFIKIASQSHSIPVIAGITGSIFSFLVMGIFHSFTLSSLLYFLLIITFAEQTLNPKAIYAKRFIPPDGLVIFICFWLFVGFLTLWSFRCFLAEYYLCQSNEALKAGEKQRALDLINKSLDYNYYNWRAHYARAEFYRHEDNPQEASNSYAKCVELHPTNLQAFLRWGLLLKKHNPHSAREKFQKALEIAPYLTLSF